MLFSSPKESIWRKVLNLLLDQRGEIGSDIQRGIPGSGANRTGAKEDRVEIDEGPQLGEEESLSPEETETEEEASGEEPETPAEALTTEEEGEPEEAESTEEEAPPPFHKHPAWIKRQKMINDLRADVSRANADRDTHRRAMEFYQAKLNEGLTAPPAQAPPAVGARPVAPTVEEMFELDQSLKDIPLRAAGQWGNQGEMARWIDHRSQTLASKLVPKLIEPMWNHLFQSQLKPLFDRIQTGIRATQEHVLRNAFKDYDEVTKPVMEQMFVFTPDGKVISQKNPALVRYIMENPMPALALYEYGDGLRRKERTASTVRGELGKTLDKIQKKPKITKIPARAGAAPVKVGLDWDTPKDVAEKELVRRGVIKTSPQ